ncbi:hypothetical protein BD780_001053 [Clostridium tetanomorphum]|nr:hypothetical protein [Clostridium tetanomorphum]NRS83828.1 hypothetical protein [Clostridium tetanomorphum]
MSNGGEPNPDDGGDFPSSFVFRRRFRINSFIEC